MAQFINFARDSFGNVIPEATVSVFNAGTETLATIFADVNNTLSKPNPFDADDEGLYSFFAEPSDVKIRVEKQGFETFEIDNVPIPVSSLSIFQQGAEISYGIVSGNIIVAIGTPTDIPFDTLVFDDGNMVDLPTIELQKDGLYSVHGELTLDAIGTTATHCDLVTSGGDVTLDSGFGTNMNLQVDGIFRGSALDDITLNITPQGGQAEIIQGTPRLTVALLYLT